MKKATTPITMAASGMPIPTPIFAPFVSPLGGIGAGGLVGVDVGFIEVVDGSVAAVEAGEILVAAKRLLESELCHHTGIPSPYIV